MRTTLKPSADTPPAEGSALTLPSVATTRLFDEKIHGEKVKLIFAQSPLPIIVSPLAAVALAAALWGTVDPRRLLWWNVALLVLAFVRAGMLIAFRRRQGVFDARVWDRRFIILYLAIALLWGAGATWVMPQPLALQAIVFAFLMGMAGGAAVTYGIHPASVLGLLCVMLPATLFFARQGDGAHTAMAFASAIYMVALYRANKLLGHYFREAHKLALELQAAKETAEQLARIDPLTEMFNRRAFYESGETTLRQAKRYAKPLSVIMLDIDRFKNINDTRGHAGGDAVIQAMARAIRDTHRETDVAGRLGGEEFAILLPETNSADATKLADRLRLKIAGTAVQYQDAAIRFTASFGVAQCDDKLDTLDSLIARADAALYQAKQSGRDRVVTAPTPGVGIATAP
jgi:diguanylate cyclase